ncbi:aldo-keto reductase yakc [NADP(+)] [Aspergillus lentulus]|uniref:Fucose-specific lectin n=1 Tax=Aspergillus lentulus TaxID=293939 RepID=A0AAN4TDK2_ASPLE|nr:aldo-keto reductase yakc [NADP(+)] [Aspergillus lentulus]
MVVNRQLGKNGPTVPALGLGLMGMSFWVYGSIPSDEERFKVLDRAVELGETFWDTSDLYGDNEELLGKWFRRTGKRDQIFLATKFGFVQGGKPHEINSSAEYCKKACDASLKRLGVDSIDLYYLHSPNPQTPIEETMRAMVELQAEGKIKHIGVSSVSSATLRRACKIANVVAVQTEYCVFSRDIEGPTGTNLLATCRELGVALVASCPLGRGVITSTFSRGEPVGNSEDKRPKVIPKFLEENRERNVKVASQFASLAEKKGCTVSQLALAWLLKQGNDIFAIPGTRRVRYLEENWGALQISLTDTEEAEIRTFAEQNEMAGGQVPDHRRIIYWVDIVIDRVLQVTPANQQHSGMVLTWGLRRSHSCTRIAAVNSTNRLRVYLQDVYGSIPESLCEGSWANGTEKNVIGKAKLGSPVAATSKELNNDIPSRSLPTTLEADGTTAAWAVPSSKLPYSGIAAVFLAGTDALQLRSYVQKSDNTIQEYMWNGNGWEEGTNLGTASPVLVSEPPPSAILTTMAQASEIHRIWFQTDDLRRVQRAYDPHKGWYPNLSAIFDKAPPRTAIAATSFGAGNSSIYMRIYFVNLDNTIWQVCWDHGKGYYDKPTITPAGQFRQ